jgi:hypothetical protein
MGGMFGGAKPPPPPPENPPPDPENDPAAIKAAEEARAQEAALARKRMGRRSTILTGGQGVEEDIEVKTTGSKSIIGKK